MTIFRVSSLITLITFLAPHFCSGEPRLEPKIPSQPSAPPSLYQRDPGKYFRCERQFLYQGKLYDCDSYLSPDAENLRPLLKKVPDALLELDLYQNNRKKARSAAYVATLGLALVFTGLLASQFYKDSNDELTPRGEFIRSLGLYGGGALGVGGLLYGFLLIKSNERHLENAVGLYNAAHPEDPIVIQVNIGFLF